MIKPIPKRLLPHNCTFQEYLGNTGEGDTWGIVSPISYVKIEEKTQLKVTSNGREVVGNAKMFYDCINSAGLKDRPEPNSIIGFNDREYRVVDTDIFYADSSNPHHYEVLLK